MESLTKWDFDRIIVGNGQIVETGVNANRHGR